jgi:hypothetical protein
LATRMLQHSVKDLSADSNCRQHPRECTSVRPRLTREEALGTTGTGTHLTRISHESFMKPACDGG